ncbi:MAG: DUF4358 domain-containing protein [Clostridia bacterium]|nr:DUF4358 domain-containing protein [Clostridia bacterium]
MKRTLIACLLFISLSLISCGTREYRDDVDATALAERVTEELNEDTDLPLRYVKDDTGLLDDYFKAPDYITDHAILYAVSTNNINELGIYRVKEGHARELAALLKTDYLQASLEKNGAWYDSYIPMETPKLRDAEVRVYGNYVVYAILNAKDRETAFDTVEDLLEK